MIQLPTVEASPKLPSGLRVKTYTFGCKVNHVDTANIENTLARHVGAKLVANEETPDVVVVNTCTVTAQADKQARQLLRRIHRENPEAKIFVTGCYSESNPEQFKDYAGVAAVVPILEQQKIPQLLGFDVANLEEEGFAEEFAGRTRAILKLQDGCNAYCSFCILPYIRGRSRSVSIEMLGKQAESFERKGFKEIVITGTHIGTYGRDLHPKLKFSDALQAIAKAAPQTSIRISSLEPTTLTPDVIQTVASNLKFRPHFHIPLQSGSDSVLRRMNRKYSVKNYAERLQKLSFVRPKMGIGADVIVGFPGETDDEFNETKELIHSLPITFLHVFRYSPRPGTKSAMMKDDVHPNIKRDRMRELVELGEKKKFSFYTGMLNSVQSVLVEKKRDADGRLKGYTPHYVPVRFKGADRLKECEVEVKLNMLEDDVVVGEAM